MTARAFPLQWPDGWPRTAPTRRARAPYKVTPDRATTDLVRSLSLLGARQPFIISSNIPLRQDGRPYADRRSPEDPGVAVYWQSRERTEKVIACDKWNEVHANIRAIGLAVDGMRAIDRAGASQILDRMLTAFAALPAAPSVPVVRPWWEVLGFPENLLPALSLPVVDARFRELVVKFHPDHGGSDEAMMELARAHVAAKAHYSAAGSVLEAK